MVFVEAVRTVEDMKRVNTLLRELNTPSLANMIEGGKTPFLTAKELQALGYSVVAYPCGSIFTAAKALQGWARYLKEHGTTNGFSDHMLTFDEYFEFIGARKIRERERQFAVEEPGTTSATNVGRTPNPPVDPEHSGLYH